MATVAQGEGTPMAAPGASRAWNILRLFLGFAQMGAVVFSGTLIVLTGINRFSLSAVVATCGLTTVSVLLFGSRSQRGWSVPAEEKSQSKRGQAALMENMLKLAAVLPHDEDDVSETGMKTLVDETGAEHSRKNT